MTELLCYDLTNMFVLIVMITLILTLRQTGSSRFEETPPSMPMIAESSWLTPGGPQERFAFSS